MQIALANPTHISEVVSFFNENLDRNNSPVYSEEFLCPEVMHPFIIQLKGQVSLKFKHSNNCHCIFLIKQL